MTGDAVLRSIMVGLATLALLAAATRAENQVLDKNDALVGTVEGWSDVNGMKPIVVYNDGIRRVPLRVQKRHFETAEIAYFLSSDCSTTPWVVADNAELGLNGMQRVIYVMQSDRKLYKTTLPHIPRLRSVGSIFLFGRCQPNTGDIWLIKADRLVANLFGEFQPPFRVE